MPPTVAWKLAFAIVLVAAIATSALARAPRRAVPPAELRRLVVCALGLYAVGGLATLTHHPALAGLVYASGIGVAALAAWLSRGRDQEDPPDGGFEPVDEEPPPEPDGMPRSDWDRFEREFRDYAQRQAGRPRAGSVDRHPLGR
ncbi:MAG TPA: hypothetical protein VMF14_05325 [Solirubrobacteraceae bacterium]|nr:hypothetical protein [Solirubrobacteraceae bacterium]